MTEKTTNQPSIDPITDNIFNVDEISDFLDTKKGDLCSLLLEHLFDRLKQDGITESDLVRGMSTYCKKAKYPQKVIDSLSNSANDLWCISRNLPVLDEE